MKKTIFIFLIFYSISVFGQGLKTLDFDKKKLKIVAGTEIVGYTSSMIGLYSLWYSDYPMSKFHFFNDNDGWQAIDKFGHALTAYTVGRLGMEALLWTGLPKNKALWYGGTLGWFFLSSVEIFDGFSDGWGASPGDLLANTFGAGLLLGQEFLWNEQRITIKFSYSHSSYQQYNPDVLGHNFQERLLKDYNGQSHWYSVNLRSFAPETKWLPPWLNLAVGYGANGMLHGYQNPDFVNGKPVPHFEVYKQFYLSPDIDLSRIKSNSKFLNLVLKSFSFLKFPMPTLEYNTLNNFNFHWLFF